MPYKDKDFAKNHYTEWEKKDRKLNPEKYKLRARRKYLAHQQKRIDWARNYRKLNPEKTREANRRSSLKNRDKRVIWAREYRKNAPRSYWDKQLENARKRREATRRKVVEYYGGVCKCCGEKEYDFLTIDHVKGGGTKHRKTITASQLPYLIVKNNFPDDYQILCYNCNCSKAFNKDKICPHKRNI